MGELVDVADRMVAATSYLGVYFLVAVLFVVAAVPTLQAHAAGRLDSFEPIIGVRALYFMYFGVAAVYELHTLDKPRLGVAIEEGIVEGLAYAIVVLLMIETGYAVAGKALRRVGGIEEVSQERWNRIFWVSIAVFVAGLGARIYGVFQGYQVRFAASDLYASGAYSGIDIFYDYLGYFSTFGYILTVAYSFTAPRPRAAQFLAWGVMLPIQLFFAFLGGPKQYFIPIVIAPLICYHYFRGRVPVFPLLLAGCIFVLIIFPIMTTYRNLDPGLLRSLDLSAQLDYAVAGVWDRVSEKGLLEYIFWGLELVVERMDGIYTFTGVLMNVPDSMEYQWGKTIMVGFAMLVPTFIWEEKYDYLSTVITWGVGIFGPDATGSGISITHPGELFLNFGPIGMLLGMLIFGAAFRLIHNWLVSGRRFFGIVIYAVIWSTLVVPEHPIAAYFSDAFKQIVLLMLISWIAGARWKWKRGKSHLNASVP